MRSRAVSGTDLEYSAPIALCEEHDASDFDSGTPVLDSWLRERALDNMLLGASRTYVTCVGETAMVAGYYALAMGGIVASDVTAAMRRNMPRIIPAVVLGRLAVDRRHQGRSLGASLLNDAVRRALRVSGEVSARLVLVHALTPAAEAFYLHHGFTRLPVETSTLALDLVRFGERFRG